MHSHRKLKISGSLDDRFGHTSTIVVSQVPVAEWFAQIPNPTLADAILDRLVHNAYRLQLVGDRSGDFDHQFGPCRTLDVQLPYQRVFPCCVRHAPFNPHSAPFDSNFGEFRVS